MEWFSQNWVWVLFAAGMIALAEGTSFGSAAYFTFVAGRLKR